MIPSLRLSATILLCTAAATAQAGTANPTYTITDLGTLSSSNTTGTQPNAINDLGEVTGYSDIDGNTTHAFLYSKGAMTDLLSLGGNYSVGNAINNSGVVVGAANYYNGFMTFMGIYAFDGYMGGIGTLGGARSFVAGINDAGQMVGSADTNSGATHAFRREKDGTFVDVTAFSGAGTNSYGQAINQGGAIVGQANVAGDAHFHAFVAAGIGFDLTPNLTNDDSCAYALNNGVDPSLSRVVGSVGTNANERAAIFAVNTAPALLGSLPGGDSSSRALGVNDAGTIVGFASVTTATHAFIYRSQDASPTMVDLNDLIPANGVVLTSATGINSSGQICAIGHDATAATPYDRAYLVSPIVAPTPQPVVAAPGIAAKKTVKTSSTSVTVKGTASGNVTSITYTVGSKKGTARGTANWSFKATNLKTGKNIATVIAHGPGGDSAPVKITITRK
ncbi:MAG TPA: hypothetical protein VNB29_07460 [Chthoniobacterales bacterium]|nr:hypothetical protein [Chthoniobacterales bacterium]